MTKQIKLYNYKNPLLDDDRNAKFFSILSNNYPLLFKNNNYTWNSVSHYIYGNLLNSIPSFHENINFKNYKLDFPYDENFHYKKNLSLYTVDIFNYINTFLNHSPTLKQKITPDMSYSTHNNNTILNVLSSDDFNLGKIYNKYISLEQTKNKVNSIEQHDQQNINDKKKILIQLYTVIQGLKLLMYKHNNLNNLETFENFTFDEILLFINDTFGKINLSYPINLYNIYDLYTQKIIEYYSIYEKILNNITLKDHIVKLFIINNYQKFNNLITTWCKHEAYQQIIQNHLKEFIKLGEDPDDFDSEPIPYNINENDSKLLLNQAYNNLNNFKNELLDNVNISCSVKIINETKINSLYKIIKNLKNTPPDNSLLFNNNESSNQPQHQPEDDIQLNLNFEEQMIHSLNLSNKTLIDDNHPLSPLKHYPTTINNLSFNNIIEYIYFNEFLNLLNVINNTNRVIAYELLFIDNTSEVKSIEQLQQTNQDLFIKICTQLFHNCIYDKLMDTHFKIALHFSNVNSFKLIHEHPSEHFLEQNLFGELLENISTDNIESPPDNYVLIINMLISNNTTVYNWIDNYIYYLCNMYIALSFHFKQFISTEDLSIFIDEWITTKFNLNNFKSYIPPIFDSFKYKIFCINNDLVKKYNILLNTNLINTNIDISPIIWNTICKLIEYLYSFKQDELSMKLQYLLIHTQQIELSYHNIKSVINKITNLLQINNLTTQPSIILSIITGNPVSSDDPIKYIQSNIESTKLPTSNEFYSNTKNKIFTFYD